MTYIRTEEHKRNISLAKKGKPSPNKGKKFGPLSEEHKMAISNKMKGRKFSYETIEKMREAQRLEKHPNWKGGVSFKNGYTSEFGVSLRKEIRKRDNFCCRRCGGSYENTRLEVHHIDEDKSNNSKDNLITLCVRCHRRLHPKKAIEESQDLLGVPNQMKGGIET